jgi:uncharacterized protein (DUF2236 family)
VVAHPVNGDFDIRRYMYGVGAQLAGTANVIMQLSRPAVGYGVKESKVESGSAMKHPVKRARTTFTYLAVAMLGTDEERALFRKAVNRQHVQVRSDESSPVAYNAMDPELQLWVAACLYYGFVDMYERMFGPLGEAEADALYAYSARMGTTLQVRDDMWPADRAAFAEYWERGLAETRIDEPIRRYLDSLARLENLPEVVRRLSAKNNLFWTRGFLPPPIRWATRGATRSRSSSTGGCAGSDGSNVRCRSRPACSRSTSCSGTCGAGPAEAVPWSDGSRAG